jgi:hypothetical protein
LVVSESELATIADKIVADARHYYGVSLDEKKARALHRDIMMRLYLVRAEARRAWLGSALTRARGE